MYLRFGFSRQIFLRFASYPNLVIMNVTKNTLSVPSNKNTKIKYIPPTTPFSDSKKKFSSNKIVLIKYDENTTTTLKKSTPELVLQTLIPDSWISPIPENALLFMNWVQKLSFYELTYSDTPLAIKKFESLFNT